MYSCGSRLITSAILVWVLLNYVYMLVGDHLGNVTKMEKKYWDHVDKKGKEQESNVLMKAGKEKEVVNKFFEAHRDSIIA